MFKSILPLNVQFEVTYQCNNRCTFCYNDCDYVGHRQVNTSETKRILHNLVANGVLGVNFNGGEPLMRSDFFAIAAYAKDLGLDIHLNTNLTLVQDAATAKKIATLFPAICTSILSSDSSLHDALSGRNGAFNETLQGIRLLQAEGVYVAVNTMLCKENIAGYSDTLELLCSLGVQTVLATRFVSCSGNDNSLHVEDSLFYDQLRSLLNFQQKRGCFARISLPQPIPICRVPADLVDVVRRWNIPCSIGLCTASITYDGFLTPCNLVKKPILGNLLNDNLAEIWSAYDGGKFCETQHLSSDCLSCRHIANCGGGCKGYNDGLRSCVNKS